MRGESSYRPTTAGVFTSRAAAICSATATKVNPATTSGPSHDARYPRNVGLLRLIHQGKIRYVLVNGIAHIPVDALDEYRARAS